MYIPQHVQQALVKQMEKSVPANMRQYVAPFLAQQGAGGMTHMTPSTPPHATAARPFVPHPIDPTAVGSQRPFGDKPGILHHEAGLPGQPTRPASPVPPPAGSPVSGPQASYAAALGQEDVPAPAYDFIMDSGKPNQSPVLPKAPGAAAPLLMRIVLVAGGLVALIVVFVVLKGFLSSSGSSNKLLLIGVAQRQQAIIHIVSTAGMEKSLSTPNKNFALTAELSLTSAQSELIGYLPKIGVKKVPEKVLILKTDPKIDTELTTASTEDTYNSTFQGIMQTQIHQYQLELQAAYKATPGVNGRKILQSEFGQSKLLEQQLSDGAVPSL